MARPLLMAHPGNATIEELKQVSRVGSNETPTCCSAIQMLLACVHRKLDCKTEEKLLERLDQAILEVIDKAEKTQQTTAIGTLF
jgi:hypothetical protein